MIKGKIEISMSSKQTTAKKNTKRKNYVAVYYKSNGKFVGPWGGEAFCRQEFETLRNEGFFSNLSNYVLRSPLQYRYRTTAAS